MSKKLNQILNHREKPIASLLLKIYAWLLLVSSIVFLIFGISSMDLDSTDYYTQTVGNLTSFMVIVFSLGTILVSVILMSVSNLLDDLKQNNNYLKYLVTTQFYQSEELGKIKILTKEN